MLHKARYLSNLTPLRGIAALLVAIFHFEMVAARFVPVSTTLFVERGYIWVDLFFIMSGFIMMHVYGEDFSKAVTGGGYKKFIVARFARIYPLHIFTLLLMIFIFMVLLPGPTMPDGIENPAAIPTNILLIQSFGIHKLYSWNIPAWSISAEWWSYMVFPFLALFLAAGGDKGATSGGKDASGSKVGGKKLLSALVLLAAVLALYGYIMFLAPRKNNPLHNNVNTTFDYGYLRGLAGFISGMLVYQLYRLSAVSNFFSRDLVSLVIGVLLIVSLHYGVNDGLIVTLYAMLVLNFAANTGIVHKICNNKVLQYLGDISYSIYLMQIFLQEPFSKGLRLPGTIGVGRGKQNIDFTSGALYCLAYILALVAISSVTYYGIERPCRKFINRKWNGENSTGKNLAVSGGETEKGAVAL